MKEQIAHSLALEFDYIEFGDSIQVFDDYIYFEVVNWKGDVKIRFQFDYDFFVYYKKPYHEKIAILIKDIYRYLTARAYVSDYDFEAKTSF